MVQAKDIEIDNYIEFLKLNYHEKRKATYWLLKDVSNQVFNTGTIGIGAGHIERNNDDDLDHDLDEVIKNVLVMKENKASITNLRILRERLQK